MVSRVLIVEDREDNLYYLASLLRGHGWEVDSARHGEEALVKARLQPPDLVVSDLLMPVMDGYTLLRQWRLDGRLKRIPFVVYTATYTAPEDEQLALDLGADAFVLKPAEPEDFVALLRKVEGAVAADDGPRPQLSAEEEVSLLDAYSSTLIRKLAQKTLELEEANRALQRDIEERERIAEKLREQAALLDCAQDAILVRDLDHRVVLWNRGAERTYGWSAQEAIGRPITELIYDERAQLERAHAALLAGGEWSGELEQRTRDGRRLVVEGRWTLLRDAAGEPKSILVINTDVTQRKRVEAQSLRSQRMESIGTLAAGIAHDLNNILSPILMSVQSLREKLPAAEDRATVATLESCCYRGAELVRQVLSFARGIAGERIELDPGKVAAELVAILRGTFPKSITLDFGADQGLWRVLGDPVQLHQVLLNLSVNARDAMPDGGVLAIRLDNCELDAATAEQIADGAPGRHVRLTVRDQGVGIPAELLETVFEPFFTTKEHGKGSGLGLATTQAIVRSHGGFIEIDSVPGSGSTFTVYLPAAGGATARTPVGEGVAPATRGNGETILVVDDEPAIRAVTRSSLELAGYRVLLASDGVEALEIYREHGPAIAAVVTDLAMPRMDGLRLAAALRQIEPRVRILLTSGLGLDGGPAAATAAGIAGPLLKPFTLEMLLAQVQRLLREAPPG